MGFFFFFFLNCFISLVAVYRFPPTISATTPDRVKLKYHLFEVFTSAIKSPTAFFKDDNYHRRDFRAGTSHKRMPLECRKNNG